MIRVLHVFGKLNLGGAESRVMDIYRHLDRSRVQFDFVVHSQEKGYYEDEIHSMGGRIFRVPRFRVYNLFSYKKAFKELFEDNRDEFAVVHGHMTSTASIYLPIAKKAGVRTTVAHARSAGVDPGIKGTLTRILRRNLWKKADNLFACSKKAGIAVFGQKATDKGLVRFVPNAIRVALFAYNAEVRNEIRNELGISDSFVIGHVGRFHYSKNHEFLLEIFKELAEAAPEIHPVLLLIGDGPLLEDMKTKAKSLGISDKVIFAGNKSDVFRYYNAMDMFVYPSRYEGLPGTVVEAQSSGLETIISDTICEEVMLTDLVSTMSLNAGSGAWAERISDVIHKSDDTGETDRSKYARQVYEAGFDVTLQAQKMTRFYESGSYE